MVKTKVLLAFGTHHGTKRKEKADRPFFRDSVAPFLEEEIIKNGKRAAIIYEVTLEDYIPSSPKSKEEMRMYLSETGNQRKRRMTLIQQELTKLERTITQKWRETRDRGEPFMKVSLDWGFEDIILEINRSRPNQITHYAEPQSSEATYAWWATDILLKELDRYRFSDRQRKLGIMIDYIMEFVKHDVLRDKSVFSLAERLRRENADRVIIIPRGTAHRGMNVLFKPDHYNVVYKESEDVLYLDFLDEFIAKNYIGTPPKEDLMRYAKLQLDCMEYVSTHRYTPSQIFMRIFGNKSVAKRELELTQAGRQFALSKRTQ